MEVILVSEEKSEEKIASSAPKLLKKSDEGSFANEERKDRQGKWEKLTRFKSQNKDYNVFPLYFYAGFWIRFFAFLFDLFCIANIQRILVGSLYNLFDLNKGGSFISVYNLLNLIIYLGYFILFTRLNNGQTLGKMAFGIRVISFDEEELSWQTVLVREGACRFILKTGILVVGYLPAAFTQYKQQAGDWLSGTSVVTLSTLKAFNAERS